MYAVVDIQGHQYIVHKDAEIVVDRIEGEEKKLIFDRVLCIFDAEGSVFQLWNPYVTGASISAEREEDKKGDKMRIVKFKRKTRYERTIWFRPYQTVLKIKNIVHNG